jgi:hypothetical protein
MYKYVIFTIERGEMRTQFKNLHCISTYGTRGNYEQNIFGIEIEFKIALMHGKANKRK